MEVEVKPRFIQDQCDKNIQKEDNLPAASAASEANSADDLPGFWDSLFKYRTIIIISVIITILVCCVIYFFWSKPSALEKLIGPSDDAPVNSAPKPGGAQQPSKPAEPNEANKVATPQQSNSESNIAELRREKLRNIAMRSESNAAALLRQDKPDDTPDNKGDDLAETNNELNSLDDALNDAVDDTLPSDYDVLGDTVYRGSDDIDDVVTDVTDQEVSDSHNSETTCPFEFKNKRLCGKKTNGREKCARHINC